MIVGRLRAFDRRCVGLVFPPVLHNNLVELAGTRDDSSLGTCGFCARPCIVRMRSLIHRCVIRSLDAPLALVAGCGSCSHRGGFVVVLSALIAALPIEQ